MPVRTQPLRDYPHNAIKIAVDFDGTVVTHDYPRVAKDIGAVSILKELVSNGCEIILFTMRDGPALSSTFLIRSTFQSHAILMVQFQSI